MMCIVFKLNMCLGCNALEYDVDKVKQCCETYKDFMRGKYGSRNTVKITKLK